jgi:replicative DNA helicase
MEAISQAIVDTYIPPHNIEAEMCALGSMIRTDRASQEVLTILNEDDFYLPAHRMIFRAIHSLALASKAIDLVTVKNALVASDQLDDVGGVESLIQIVASAPTPANAAHYAHIVLDLATLRRLERAGQEIARLVHEPDAEVQDKLNRAEQLVYEVGRKRLGKYFRETKDFATEFFEDVDRLVETGQPILGLPTGFADLDRKTAGFFPGELTVVAARPSMGKTSLMLEFALHAAAKDQGNVAIFSLEMSGKALVRRLVSMLSEVDMSALRRPGLSNDDYQRLADATEKLYGLPIFVDESSDLSPVEMRGKLRRLEADGGLSLVLVDYLQLMRSSKRAENRVQEISDIVRSLKAIAKELEVPVVALSQLNRGVEGRDDKRPQLGDLRESGSIEAEADVVMLIYRDSYYRKKQQADFVENPHEVQVAEVNVGKHRNGPTGIVKLGFIPAFARFKPLSDRTAP